MVTTCTDNLATPTPVLTHLGWQVRKAPEWSRRFQKARDGAEQSIARRRPISPEHERMIREEYRDEAALHQRVEDLASQLIEAAGELGWGSGDPVLDAIDWICRVADERGLPWPQFYRDLRPPTRREEANRAIAKAFRRIGERDGFRCRVCGADRTLTVDHIVAVVNGGTDDDDNLQLLCRSHNSRKGTR